MACAVCDDTGWVCEAHPDRPAGMFSERAEACRCGAAAMPCPECNPSRAGVLPDMTRTGMAMMSGARYEIAIDGTPRAYRDRADYAREAATLLKVKQPNAEITVRDTQTGTTTVIKHPSGR
jgi:hypothetical protein